jgi:hypothetical protein
MSTLVYTAQCLPVVVQTDLATRVLVTNSSQILVKIANLFVDPIPFMCDSGNTVTRIKMTKTSPESVQKDLF